jgi:hypothetical protein
MNTSKQSRRKFLIGTGLAATGAILVGKRAAGLLSNQASRPALRAKRKAYAMHAWAVPNSAKSSHVKVLLPRKTGLIASLKKNELVTLHVG